jgi:hypothetical protein
VATSERFTRYLGSTKNLAGSACGLIGLGLYLFGWAGPYWPLVIIGLYAAGALAAPPEKVTLVLDDTAAEAGRLRTDLDGLVSRVDRHRHRLPAAALTRLGEITSILYDLLGRTAALTGAPEQLYEITRAIRTDLPTSLETYLNLPRWYAARRLAGGRNTAAEELVTQLDLLKSDLTKTAEQVFATDTRRLRDQTRYLQDRGRGGELDLPG